MPRTRRCDVFLDDTLLFRSWLPISTMVGSGMVLGALPYIICMYINTTPSSNPTEVNADFASSIQWLPLVMGLWMMSPTLLAMFQTNVIPGKSADPISQRVLKGRHAARIEGDFVVFLIGSRANGNVHTFYKWMGDAMGDMIRELEEDASKNGDVGFLGGESFVGATGTLMVQYWKSLDHLNGYARNQTNEHAGPWARLMKYGRENHDCAFWHESFAVKAGNYEAIYVNSAPVHLANCHGVNIIPARGKLATAAGRAGKTDGTDYPKNLGVPDY